MEQKSNKTIVRECYRKIIRDLDLSLVDSYVREDYIQHSPTIKDRRAGLLEMLNFLQKLPKPQQDAPSPIIRLIAEGDLVAVHLDIKYMGKSMAVIDLFRLQNGQLAEHWDVSQVQPDQADSSITMTNGSTFIDDSVDGNKSKMVVLNLYRDVFEQKNLDAVNKYISDDFIEHCPANGLLDNTGYTVKVHRLIAEGNFVVAQCEYRYMDNASAAYSIFRINADKIEEHWKVEQDIPATMAHCNGMF